MGNTNCFQCVAELRLAQTTNETVEEIGVGQKVDMPDIREAITWVPVWQQQNIMGNMVMACVALPACLEHISARPKTAEERAMNGGIALGRAGMMPGSN